MAWLRRLYNPSAPRVARFIFHYEGAATAGKYVLDSPAGRDGPAPSEGEKMADKPHVVFYTKPGCHLCDEAREEMWNSGCAGLYTYEEVDILSDGGLTGRYGWDI